MRKGDMRRSELIAAAERLFYTKGYEKTSVQDILTEIGFSKGGFYHHFDSKLSVLEAICEQRAAESGEQARAAVLACKGTAVEKLNAVFSASQMLSSEHAGFVTLLLQVAYREDGALMREKMKHSQMESLLPLFEEIVSLGAGQQEFFVPDVQGCAQMLLRMQLMLTDEIAFLLNREESEEQIMDAAVRKLNLYRTAIERMLLAPFGSIELLDAREMQALVQRVIRERVRRRADALLTGKA